jgi:hypothetical protein
VGLEQFRLALLELAAAGGWRFVILERQLDLDELAARIALLGQVIGVGHVRGQVVGVGVEGGLQSVAELKAAHDGLLVRTAVVLKGDVTPGGRPAQGKQEENGMAGCNADQAARRRR